MTENALLSSIPARERRKAKTKLALIGVAAQRIEDQPLENISVRELCHTVQVSETTFFNYFSRKSDLLAYCVQLWNLEITLRASQAAGGRPGLAMIGELFEQVARHVQGRPALTGEMIAFLAKRRGQSMWPKLSATEKQLAFPEFAHEDNHAPETIEEALKSNLAWAIENGELPPNTKPEAITVALTSLFYGIPIALRATKPLVISQAYRQQLNVLWLGVRESSGRGLKPPSANRPSLHHRHA